jgi:hypothetical protein
LSDSPAATTERNKNGKETTMRVKILSFSRSSKPAVLAEVVGIELAVEGDSIIIAVAGSC